MLASGTLSPVASLLLQPHRDRLGDVLNLRLQDPRWTTFRAAVAFVKRGVGARMRAGLRASHRRARHLPMRYETGLPSAVIRFRT